MQELERNRVRGRLMCSCEDSERIHITQRSLMTEKPNGIQTVLPLINSGCLFLPVLEVFRFTLMSSYPLDCRRN